MKEKNMMMEKNIEMDIITSSSVKFGGCRASFGSYVNECLE